jgi:hypothetical protein
MLIFSIKKLHLSSWAAILGAWKSSNFCARRSSNVCSKRDEMSAPTLHRQLDERGYIKSESTDGNVERTLTRKFDGKANRVLVFKTGIEVKT